MSILIVPWLFFACLCWCFSDLITCCVHVVKILCVYLVVCNKFTWPPKTEPEIESQNPTATPLYIPPTPRPISHPEAYFPQKTETFQIPESISSIPSLSTNCVTEKSTSHLNILPSQQPLSGFTEVHIISEQENTNQSFNSSCNQKISLSKQSVSESVTTIEAQCTKNNQIEVSKDIILSKESTNEQNIEMQASEAAVIHKKLSICSEEVNSITDMQASLQVLSESATLNTIQESERPQSPTPEKVEVVSHDSSPDVATKKLPLPDGNSEKSLEEGKDKTAITTAVDNSVPKEVIEESLSKVGLTKPTEEVNGDKLEKGIENSMDNILPIKITTSLQIQQPTASPKTQDFNNLLAKNSLQTDFSKSVGWQSPMVKALTVAPERPYSPFSTVSPIAPGVMQTGLAYRQLPEQLSTSFKPITADGDSHSVSNVPDHSLICALTVAPDRPYSPLPSPMKPISIPAPVPFPKETAPYLPKSERPARCPSPMDSALTVAPARPFSPLPPATRAMTPLLTETESQNIQATTKNTETSVTNITDLPLLPKPIQRMSLVSALTIAPDRPFSPFPSVTQAPNILSQVQSQSSAFIPVMKQNSQPRTDTAPKLFPMPTMPTLNVLHSEQSQPNLKFPPVTDELKAAFQPQVQSAKLSQTSQSSLSSDIAKEVNVKTLVNNEGNIQSITTRVEEYKETQIQKEAIHLQKQFIAKGQHETTHDDMKVSANLCNKMDMKKSTDITHLATKASNISGLKTYQDIPYYQQDIERYQIQRTLSPVPLCKRSSSRSPSPAPPTISLPPIYPQKIPPLYLKVEGASENKSVESVKNLPAIKISDSESQSAVKQLIQHQENNSNGSLEQCKLYSLSNVKKPSVIPFYQEDIENYQIHRVLSPLPISKSVAALSRSPSPDPTLRQSSPLPATGKIYKKPAGIATPFQQALLNSDYSSSKQLIQSSFSESTSNESAVKLGLLQDPKQIKAVTLPQATTKSSQNLQASSSIRENQLTLITSSTLAIPAMPLYQRPPQPLPGLANLSNKSLQTIPVLPTIKSTMQNSQAIPNALNKPSQLPQSIVPMSVPPNKSLNSSNSVATVTKIPDPPSCTSLPNAGGGPGKGTASFAGSFTPRRGRGTLNQPSTRIPLCGCCNMQIRGPFITALGKIWCPEHFVCATPQCRRQLADIGFVEEQDHLYCEFCFEKYIAPNCDKCSGKIRGDCLKAIGKHFHPECFLCAYCGKLFGNNPFFMEDGLPYCEADWNELFTTKCFACGFPIEAGDRWVEALNNNYHSQCFNCTNCKKNLEGQSFYAKGGRPFCKAHAR